MADLRQFTEDLSAFTITNSIRLKGSYQDLDVKPKTNTYMNEWFANGVQSSATHPWWRNVAALTCYFDILYSELSYLYTKSLNRLIDMNIKRFESKLINVKVYCSFSIPLCKQRYVINFYHFSLNENRKKTTRQV